MNSTDYAAHCERVNTVNLQLELAGARTRYVATPRSIHVEVYGRYKRSITWDEFCEETKEIGE